MRLSSTGRQNNLTKDKSLDTSLLIAEYNALREEILKRMDTEHQLLTFAILVFGTILGIGFQNKIASIILLYPTLALFLAVGHAHSDYQVRQIGRYIKDHIETTAGAVNMYWEHFSAENRYSLYLWEVRGVFIMTELLAIAVGISLVPFNTTFLAVLAGQSIKNPNFTINALLVIAMVSLLLTPFLLYDKPVKPITKPITLDSNEV